MKHLTLFLFCFATISGFAQQDIVVNGSGLPGTYSTISAAVQAANPGDKILVSNQAFPYQEDTLFIDRDLTIMPYSEITHIDFQGHISIALDSISELTLIGFDSYNFDVLSKLNDTSRTFLSEVNIIDCQFGDLDFEHPKTSLYLSYSNVNYVYFSHGDIIGNKIQSGLIMGCVDWDSTPFSNNPSYNYQRSLLTNENNLGDSGFPTACALIEKSMTFGNVQVYSDTCNIIANEFGGSQYGFYNTSSARAAFNSQQFAFNVRNNLFPSQSPYSSIFIYQCCSATLGVNQIVNNNLSDRENSGYSGVRLCLAYCTNEPITFNFEEVKLEVLNNVVSGRCIWIDAPDSYDNSNYGNYTSTNLIFNEEIVVSYNETNAFHYENAIQGNGMFLEGPSNWQNSNPNPSPAHLNLDLTPNVVGRTGGSNAWSNYHPNGEAGFDTMTGSKARITYLNLPYQIFDPSTIQIKARAVHGN